MKTYNVGILGFGFIGKVHAYAHRNLSLYYDPLPFRTRITHVCTAHAESAAQAQQQLGELRPTTDFREITENPDVDVVHICTPNHCHRDALLSAMATDKHIYCDKPLVATAAEADEIEAALGSYQGIAQMTFQNRFFPATLRAKQLLDEGFVGDVLEFRCAYLHAGSADPQAPLKWKLSAAAGGGVIADLASHALDLMHHLVGELTELTARTHIAYPKRPSLADPDQSVSVDAEDCVMILGTLANDAIGTIEATKIATGTEDELRFEIHGSRGALRFNSMRPHQLEIYDATTANAPIGGQRGWLAVDTGQRYPSPGGWPGPKFSIGWIRTHVACLYNFMAAVDADEQPEPDLQQGIYIQRLMDRVRAAAEKRET